MKTQNPAVPVLPGYLNITALRPLDVIALASVDDTHDKIRKYSRGQVAHVALVLTPMVLFEATRGGLCFDVWEDVRCSGDGTSQLLTPLDGFAVFRVLRHPELADLSEEDLAAVQANALELCASLNLLNFPNLLRLFAAIPGLGFTEPFLRKIADTYDRAVGKTPSGLFCSELVASVFEGVNMPILPGGNPASTASPQAILDSKLVDVTRAVLPADTACVEILPAWQNAFGRVYAKLKQQQEEVQGSSVGDTSSGGAEVKKSLIDWRREKIEKIADLLRLVHENLRALSRRQRAAGARIERAAIAAVKETIERHRMGETEFIRELIPYEQRLFALLADPRSTTQDIECFEEECPIRPIHDVNKWLAGFTAPIVNYLNRYYPDYWARYAPAAGVGNVPH